MTLDLEVRFLINGTWTDVTSHLSASQNPLEYAHGRPDEASQSDPAKCTFSLLDPTGRFVEDNPRSDLFGNFGRGTLGYVKWGSTEDNYVDLPGLQTQVVYVPDNASLDTGSTRLRFTVEAEAPSGLWGEEPVDLYPLAKRVLLSRWEADNSSRSWRFYVTNQGYLGVDISSAGTTFTSYTSTVSLQDAGCVGRAKLRAYYNGTQWVFEFDTGSGFIAVGSAVAGANTVKNVDVRTWIGSQGIDTTNPASSFHGKLYRATVESGTGFPTVLFDADFRFAPVAISPLADGTVIGGGATLVDPDLVFLGEVVSLEHAGDKAEATMFTNVTLTGVSRRLNPPEPLEGSVYRTSTQLYAESPDLVAYWPCEDPTGNTTFGSVVDGVGPLIPRPWNGVSTRTQFAADGIWYSSDPLPVWHAEGFYALVPHTSPVTNEMTFAMFIRMPGGGFPGNVDFGRVYVEKGTLSHVVVGFEADGDVRLSIRTSAGANTTVTADLDLPGQGGMLVVNLRPLPGTPTSMEWRMTSILGDGSTRTATGNFATTSLGAISGFDTSPFKDGYWWDGDFNGATFGHISIWSRYRIAVDAPEFFDTLYDRFFSYVLEASGTRLARHTVEEGIPVRLEGHPEDTQRMWVMARGTRPDQRLTAEQSDGGLLCDAPDSYSLVYRTTRALLGMPVLTVSYSGGVMNDPWAPVWDDEGIRNDVTVNRAAGGSARAVLLEGPRSILEPPDGVRHWSASFDRDFARREQVQPAADWLLWLGTAAGSRMPEVGFNLGNPRVLATYGDALRRLVPGSRLRITNPPAWMHPDPVELQVQQLVWTLFPGTNVATVSLTCRPGEPWMGAYASNDATAAEDEFEPHVDTAGALLVAAIDDNDTTFTVGSHADLPFSEDPDDLAGGCLLRLGGPQGPTDETVNLDAVDPFLVDTFTRTVVSGWGSPDTGPAWTTFATGAATSVSGGLGLLTALSANRDAGAYTGTDGDGWDLTTQLSLSALPTGAGILVAARLNWEPITGDFYQVGLTIATSGAITMECAKIVNGAFVSATSAVLPFNLAALTNYDFHVTAKNGRVRGLLLPSSPAYNASGWQVELASDGSPLPPGRGGVYAFRGGGATNGPNVRFDNLSTRSPQVFTVSRGYWGWASAHASTTPVNLRYPWVVGP